MRALAYDKVSMGKLSACFAGVTTTALIMYVIAKAGSVCNRIQLNYLPQSFLKEFYFKKKVTHVKRAANGATSMADKSSLPTACKVHYKHRRPEAVKHRLLQLYFYLRCLQAFQLPISHLFTYLYCVPKTKPQKNI